MVIYVKNITIPPNTPKTDPIEETVEIGLVCGGLRGVSSDDPLSR